MVIGERQMNMRFIAAWNHCVEPRFCSTRQRQSWCARWCIDDADVFHEHAALETCAHGFGKSLFGREALGVGAGLGERTLCRLGAFDVGKDPFFKSFTEPLKRIGDTLNIAQIGSQADYQRAISISIRILRTLSSRPIKMASPIR